MQNRTLARCISIPTGAIQRGDEDARFGEDCAFQFQQVQFRVHLARQKCIAGGDFNSNRCNSERRGRPRTRRAGRISIPTGAIQSSEPVATSADPFKFQFQQVQFRGLSRSRSTPTPQHFNSNRCNSEPVAPLHPQRLATISIPTGAIQRSMVPTRRSRSAYFNSNRCNSE